MNPLSSINILIVSKINLDLTMFNHLVIFINFNYRKLLYQSCPATLNYANILINTPCKFHKKFTWFSRESSKIYAKLMRNPVAVFVESTCLKIILKIKYDLFNVIAISCHSKNRSKFLLDSCHLSLTSPSMARDYNNDEPGRRGFDILY